LVSKISLEGCRHIVSIEKREHLDRREPSRSGLRGHSRARDRGEFINPNRTARDESRTAQLMDLRRLDPDFPLEWLGAPQVFGRSA